MIRNQKDVRKRMVNLGEQYDDLLHRNTANKKIACLGLFQYYESIIIRGI